MGVVIPSAGAQSDLPPAASSRHLRWVMFALLSLSVVYFTWRSIPRGLSHSMDLTVGFAAAHALLAGENPYDPAILNGQLAVHGAPELAEQGVMGFYRNLYFPPTLPLYLPLTVVSWPVAKVLWLVGNLLGVAIICWGLLRYTGVAATSNRGLGFLAFVIALAPVHTAIAMGQNCIPSVAAIVVAMLLEKSGRRGWAGVAYGLAAAIKVQLGLPFIAYIIWRRRWPTVGASLAVLCTLSLMAVAWMQSADNQWLPSWQSNVVQTTTGGGHNDPTLANPGRHSMIGLPVLLHSFTDNRTAVRILTSAVVLAAAFYAMCHISGRYPEPASELSATAVVSVLALLVSYHRTYDAVLLAIPLAWSVVLVPRSSVWFLVAASLWLVPAQTMLATRFDGAPSHIIVVQTYSLLVMAGVQLGRAGGTDRTTQVKD